MMLLDIDSNADVGVCRRKAVKLATHIGFDAIKSGEVAILVSELATNVLKHGGGKGKLLMCKMQDAYNRRALEIWCCDSGIGIPDFNLALDDGFTNKNTLGIGMGTIRRFTDVFEKCSENGLTLNGTELISSQYKHCLHIVKWLPEPLWKGVNRQLLLGAASRPKPGELLNGDSYLTVHLSATKTLAAVIDGLGHGKEAHLAATILKEQILLKSDMPLNELIQYLHNSVRGTRGAVIGLVLINTDANTLQFVGIGNIEGFVRSVSDKKSLISYGGILGHNMRTPRFFEFKFDVGDSLCMYSDGLNSRWNISDIDWKEHPQKNAEYLIQNYSRMNDDATILIIHRTV